MILTEEMRKDKIDILIGFIMEGRKVMMNQSDYESMLEISKNEETEVWHDFSKLMYTINDRLSIENNLVYDVCIEYHNSKSTT